MSDTTTQLNVGSGGDLMDESAVVQNDGTTTAKRPRVELALADDPGATNGGTTPRLVNKNNPLPVSDEGSLLEIAMQILEELRQIRALLEE